jgi:hypothetical protein
MTQELHMKYKKLLLPMPLLQLCNFKGDCEQHIVKDFDVHLSLFGTRQMAVFVDAYKPAC